MSKLFSKISKIVSLLSALNLGFVPSMFAASDVADNSATVDSSSVEGSSTELLPVMPVVNNDSENFVAEKINAGVSGAESIQVNSDVKSGDLGGTYADRILGNSVGAPVSYQSPDYLEKYLNDQSWANVSASVLMAMLAVRGGMDTVRVGTKMYDGYKDGWSLGGVAKEHALSLICNAAVTVISTFLAYKSFKASIDADVLRNAYFAFKSSPVVFDESAFDATSQLKPDSADIKDTSASVDSLSVNAQPDASMAMKILM